MYNLFRNHRGPKEDKARATTTRATAPWKTPDKKKLDFVPYEHCPLEIHVGKPPVPSKPKEKVATLPSTPFCHGPSPPLRRDSFSTITTIEELEAASSSCVQSQITELSEGIPHFISFIMFSEEDEEDLTISASNMPLIKKANKFLPDSSNVGDFYGDDYDHDDDCYINNNISTACTSPKHTAHGRKSPRQLLNQMDSFTNRKREGRPALRRGESMGLNALSPPLRSGTLSPQPVRSSLHGIGRRRRDMVEI
ncbi:unnamed protein product [Cylindrotheca closterium]|uniref:Uncharacterized protein n=1 Tax=Cylindrotheca closterium TaxID=2856 RepID=A0AAD2CVP9_9STRA|nr:unnamed protein product [Cylindrotheca closterium]